METLIGGSFLNSTKSGDKSTALKVQDFNGSSSLVRKAEQETQQADPMVPANKCMKIGAVVTPANRLKPVGAGQNPMVDFAFENEGTKYKFENNM
jgi:hypothetical protein